MTGFPQDRHQQFADDEFSALAGIHPSRSPTELIGGGTVPYPAGKIYPACSRATRTVA
jgi:hypothetical protein